MENKGNNSTNNDNTDPADLQLWGSMWSGYSEANNIPTKGDVDTSGTSQEPSTENNPAADTPQPQDKGQPAKQKGFADYEAYQTEKTKYTGSDFNGSWAKMTHWYKEHPDELSDIMFDGAEHDLEWYQQNPKHISDLVRDWLARDKDTTDKAKIGDVELKKIEQDFSDFDQKELERLEGELNSLRPKIAELYARNSRLVNGKKNRYKFIKIEGEYGALLDKCLRLKAKSNHEAGKRQNADKLEAKTAELVAEIKQKLTEFAGGDLEHPEKSQEEIDTEKVRLQEEANQKLTAYFNDIDRDLKIDVNAEFLAGFCKEDQELRRATNDRLDNGNKYRKFVSKILNNRAVKGTLAAAATAGLIATGAVAISGLATGAMTIGFGGLGWGTAAGAIKGGFGGFIMSRRDSKNSTVNRNGEEEGVLGKEEIINQLKGIDITNSDADISNVTNLLLQNYYDASVEDAKNNRKRTLIATGLGAVIGGLMGSLRFGTTRSTEMPTNIKGTTNPVKYGGAEKLNQVDVPKGKGLFEVFRQLGGNDADQQKAMEIAQRIGAKYTDAATGANGLADVFPGKISAWPETAQSYIAELSEAWANAEIVPREIIGGGNTVFSYSTEVVTDYIPNAFMNTITRLTDFLGGTLIGAVSGVIGTNKVAKTRGSRAINATNTPVQSTQSPKAAPAPTDSGEGSPIPISGEMAGADSELIVNNFLDTFKTAYGIEEQKEIINAILTNATPASLSPSVQGLMTRYNSALPEIQTSIVEGILQIANEVNQSATTQSH